MLFITDRCNFQCDYCYIKQGVHTLSFEVAKKVIDNIDDFTVVDMFGGEALLELDLLNRIVDYANSGGRKLIFQLFSNGSRWDSEVQALLDKGVSIGVSFDGLDQYRRTHDNKMSFKVQSNILQMREVYPWLGVKTCISPENVHRMMGNVIFMNSIGMPQVSQFILREDVWNKASIEVYREQFAREVQYFGEHLAAGDDVWLSYPAGFVIDNPRTTGCWAGSTGCAVDWNGDIYPCQRFLTNRAPLVIGNVDTGITDRRFQRYTIDNFLKCERCDIRDRCSHLCIAAQWEAGSICSPITCVCELNHISYELAAPLKEFADVIQKRFDRNRTTKENGDEVMERHTEKTRHTLGTA
jgi:uncharacterized protein